MCLPMDVKNVYLPAESLYWATEGITPAEDFFHPRKKYFPPEGNSAHPGHRKDGITIL